MIKRVRGLLFVDYVRMVRGRKDVDWSKHLEPEDEAFLLTKVDPSAWYPMSTFERLGLAILREIAHGQLEGVRMWGRFQVDAGLSQFPMLLAEGDPRDTLMRFDVLAAGFFDDGALAVKDIEDKHAIVRIAYGMSALAEETACTQSLGFFERLVERAGGKSVSAEFKTRAWKGDTATRIALDWD